MAIIRPFRALRPPKNLADQVAALPYDVMNVEEARAMASGNPYSFLHVSRPEIDLAPEIDPHDDQVHLKGKLNLDRFIHQGTLVGDSGENFYVYRQRMGDITQTGLVACAGVDDYHAGVIKKHEHTRPDKEDDRVRHIDTLNANDEPVFYISRSCGEIEEIIADVASGPAEYDFVTDDNVAHTLWVINDRSLVERLTALFATLPNLYVADGHHRSAAAERVRDLRRRANHDHTGNEEYNFFLTVIFPENQLNIMPYNRVVKDLNGQSSAEFMERVAQTFEISESPDPVLPETRHCFGMYLDGRWYRLRLQPGNVDESDSVAHLDVSILQDRLLNPLLGIHNPRTDTRIHFVGGIRGNEELVRLVDSGDYRVAFSLFPTSVGELMELADQDQIMPPKSTWFEPKLRSGLFVHLLE
jgi:uncharacterized protein (DUF1015 family)